MFVLSGEATDIGVYLYRHQFQDCDRELKKLIVKHGLGKKGGEASETGGNLFVVRAA